MLSTNAIELLAKNGYTYIENEHFVSFQRGAGRKSMILVVYSVLVLVSLVMLLVSIVSGLALLVFGSAMAYLNYQKIATELYCQLDLKSGEFQVKTVRYDFSALQAIELSSRYESSYASPFKDTSDEYSIDLSLCFQWGSVCLFRFLSDYEEPQPEIMEIKDYLTQLSQPFEMV